MIINDLYNNKKSNLSEGRMVKGPGGVPLDRQGRPIVPKAKPLSMRKWLVVHNGSHGEGGKDIIEAPNAETAWETANEYDLDIISITPYRGPARPTLVDESVLDEAVGMIIKGAAISGPDDQDIADRIAARTGGRVDSGSRGHHILITYPTPQHRAAAAAKIRKMFPGIELYKSGGNRNAIDEQGVAEGAELKQAKRKYNQAAKDANLDQVGAGKKIDTMKKSLRQKDLGKEQGMVEGNPVPGQNFTTAQGQQMNWNPTSKSWQQQAPVTPNDPYTNISNKQTMNTKDVNGTPTTSYSSTTVAKDPATGKTQTMTSNDHGSFLNGVDEDQLDEVSLGDYRKKAQLSQATSKIDRFFGRDDPEKVAAADRTIAKREKGLGRADSRIKPYTAPPVDQDKQRRDLADKYPNIDELVRQAELNRDPNYEYADGQAYYNGRDAEHKYHKLKQIQRMIRGTELDEMDFGSDDAEVDRTEMDGINTVAYDKSGKAISSTTPDLFGTGNQKTDLRTGDVTTNAVQGPYSVSQTTTPGGYTKQSTRQFKVGPTTATVSDVGPNIAAGQLAGTTTSTANVDWNGQSKQQVKGVGFGGASGPNVGKNYVGASDEELAKHLATGLTGVELNENINRMKHLAGIKSTR